MSRELTEADFKRARVWAGWAADVCENLWHACHTDRSNEGKPNYELVGELDFQVELGFVVAAAAAIHRQSLSDAMILRCGMTDTDDKELAGRFYPTWHTAALGCLERLLCVIHRAAGVTASPNTYWFHEDVVGFEINYPHEYYLSRHPDFECLAEDRADALGAIQANKSAANAVLEYLPYEPPLERYLPLGLGSSLAHPGPPAGLAPSTQLCALNSGNEPSH